jgi:hypothetical protein
MRMNSSPLAYFVTVGALVFAAESEPPAHQRLYVDRDHRGGVAREGEELAIGAKLVDMIVWGRR